MLKVVEIQHFVDLPKVTQLWKIRAGCTYDSPLSGIGRNHGHAQLGIHFPRHWRVGSDREIQLDSPSHVFLLTEKRTGESALMPEARDSLGRLPWGMWLDTKTKIRFLSLS